MVSTHQASRLAYKALFTIHPIKHHLPLSPLLDHNKWEAVLLYTRLHVFIPSQGQKVTKYSETLLESVKHQECPLFCDT